jgi:tetratricopeptide (TPR) repeat protein
VDSYTVAAYWLREHLNRVTDAEAFLREGLRANPDSYEILFELGRLYAENNRDVSRARAVLELAINKWIRQEAAKPAPDTYSYRLILGQLATLEEQAGNLDRALAHFTRLKHFSPQPDAVQKRIVEVQEKMSGKK